MRINRVGDVLTLSLSGVIRFSDCLHGHAEATAELHHTPAGGVLVDVRGAALVLDGLEYAQLVAVALKRPIWQPIGFVVSEAIMRISSAHVLAMGERGFARQFFRDPAVALAWLEQREDRAAIGHIPRPLPAPGAI